MEDRTMFKHSKTKKMNRQKKKGNLNLIYS